MAVLYSCEVIPANMTHCPNVGRASNIKPALCPCVVFARIIYSLLFFGLILFCDVSVLLFIAG